MRVVICCDEGTIRSRAETEGALANEISHTKQEVDLPRCAGRFSLGPGPACFVARDESPSPAVRRGITQCSKERAPLCRMKCAGRRGHRWPKGIVQRVSEPACIELERSSLARAIPVRPESADDACLTREIDVDMGGGLAHVPSSCSRSSS